MIKCTYRTKILSETRGGSNFPGSRVKALDCTLSNQIGGPTGRYLYNIDYFLAGIWGYLYFSKLFRRKCCVTFLSKKILKPKEEKHCCRHSFLPDSTGTKQCFVGKPSYLEQNKREQSRINISVGKNVSDHPVQVMISLDYSQSGCLLEGCVSLKNNFT